jgi:hypothetical protein
MAWTAPTGSAFLFATDLAEDNVRIVTAYYPVPAGWADDLKSRRQR